MARAISPCEAASSCGTAAGSSPSNQGTIKRSTSIVWIGAPVHEIDGEIVIDDITRIIPDAPCKRPGVGVQFWLNSERAARNDIAPTHPATRRAQSCPRSLRGLVTTAAD